MGATRGLDRGLDSISAQDLRHVSYDLEDVEADDLPGTDMSHPDSTNLAEGNPRLESGNLHAVLQDVASELAHEDTAIRILRNELRAREGRRAALAAAEEQLLRAGDQAHGCGGPMLAWAEAAVQPAPSVIAPSTHDPHFAYGGGGGGVIYDCGSTGHQAVLDEDAAQQSTVLPDVTQVPTMTDGGVEHTQYPDVHEHIEGFDLRMGYAQCGGCGQQMPVEMPQIQYHRRVCPALCAERIRARLPGGPARRHGQGRSRKLALIWNATPLPLPAARSSSTSPPAATTPQASAAPQSVAAEAQSPIAPVAPSGLPAGAQSPAPPRSCGDKVEAKRAASKRVSARGGA